MEATVKRRYVGIYLGKQTYTLAIVENNGKRIQSNGKTTFEGRQALYKKFEPGDKAALESFIMVKELEPAVGCKVRVLNPSRPLGVDLRIYTEVETLFKRCLHKEHEGKTTWLSHGLSENLGLSRK